VAVFEYKVTLKSREDAEERGFVVARDESDAKRKLKSYDLSGAKLRRIKGIQGFVKKFSANIK
jgi:type II secretory pathway component PulF